MGAVIVFDSEKVLELTNGAVTGASINADGELVFDRQGAVSVTVGVIGRGAGLAATNTLLAGSADAYLDYNTVQEESLNQDSSNWVDRMRGFFKPYGLAARTVMWLNEYFELRLAPAKHNTTPLVIYVRENDTVQTNPRNDAIPLFVLRDDRDLRTHFWGLYNNGVVKFGPNAHTDIPAIKLSAAAAVPTGLPADTIIFRTAT